MNDTPHGSFQPLPSCIVRSLFVNAVTPERLEWYMNVCRMRHRVPANFQSLLGSGTSPNEAVNATINRWLRNLGEVHSQTVSLQLKVCQLGSILSHNSALYRPTLAQIRSCDLLACVARALEIPEGIWNEFRSTETSHPLEEARARTRLLVRKRPATSDIRIRKIKRTAFTLQRL